MPVASRSLVNQPPERLDAAVVFAPGRGPFLALFDKYGQAFLPQLCSVVPSLPESFTGCAASPFVAHFCDRLGPEILRAPNSLRSFAHSPHVRLAPRLVV